jgi:hypothetical protein
MYNRLCVECTEDVARNEDGTKLRGLSRNQICVGIATDKTNTVLLVEGTGKPSQKRTLELLQSTLRQALR